MPRHRQSRDVRDRFRLGFGFFQCRLFCLSPLALRLLLRFLGQPPLLFLFCLSDAIQLTLLGVALLLLALALAVLFEPLRRDAPR